MKVAAPAKVNLYLRVVGKREDGYHLLNTLMVPVSLTDELEFTNPSDADKQVTVVCDKLEVPEEENLVYRAALRFVEETGEKRPVRIHVRKRIPVGGGLGGGSSDAATTLLALCRFWDAKLSPAALKELAAELGADVPFFLCGKAARVTGAGESVHPVSLPVLWLVILYPDFPVSTRWVYQNFDFKLTKSSDTNNLTMCPGTPEEVARALANDLETVALRHYPGIRRAKLRLVEEGAMGALMSGSGSSVFGVFATQESAQRAEAKLRSEKGAVYLVRSLT